LDEQYLVLYILQKKNQIYPITYLPQNVTAAIKFYEPYNDQCSATI